MSYVLGQFDKCAYDHGRKVVEEMREETGINGGVAHSVCVAVYVDGFLQFAGADACIDFGAKLDRLGAKNQASLILGRMDSHGEIVRRTLT